MPNLEGRDCKKQNLDPRDSLCLLYLLTIVAFHGMWTTLHTIKCKSRENIPLSCYTLMFISCIIIGHRCRTTGLCGTLLPPSCHAMSTPLITPLRLKALFWGLLVLALSVVVYRYYVTSGVYKDPTLRAAITKVRAIHSYRQTTTDRASTRRHQNTALSR